MTRTFRADRTRWRPSSVVALAMTLLLGCSSLADESPAASPIASKILPPGASTAASVAPSATPLLPGASPATDTATPSDTETASPVFTGSIAEVRGYLASLLLERSSRDNCVIEQTNQYELEALQREAVQATHGAGPGSRLLEGGYFLGDRDAAIAALGGSELLASSGGTAWYLTTPDEAPLPGLPESVLLVAVSLIELESADGRPVWWRSEDYVAVEPECTPVE